jgi:hypothetical protein
MLPFREASKTKTAGQISSTHKMTTLRYLELQPALFAEETSYAKIIWGVCKDPGGWDPYYI